MGADAGVRAHSPTVQTRLFFAHVGHGQDTFAFNPGFGNNTITDFNTSRDMLQFNPAVFANYAAAMADTKQVGANTGTWIMIFEINRRKQKKWPLSRPNM